MTKRSKISNLHKVLFFSILLIYFLAGYFFCEQFFIGKPHAGYTFVDDIVPFTPFFMIFYVLGYFMVLGPAIVVNDKKEFHNLFLCFILIMTFSFMIFLIFPIEIIRPVPTGDDIFSKMILMQQDVDAGFNTFPSLHVSQDFFAFLIIRNMNRKLGNYMIPLVILVIFSTMFVKQHHFIDVVGGIIIASFAYWFYKSRIASSPFVSK